MIDTSYSFEVEMEPNKIQGKWAGDSAKRQWLPHPYKFALSSQLPGYDLSELGTPEQDCFVQNKGAVVEHLTPYTIESEEFAHQPLYETNGTTTCSYNLYHPQPMRVETPHTVLRGSLPSMNSLHSTSSGTPIELRDASWVLPTVGTTSQQLEPQGPIIQNGIATSYYAAPVEESSPVPSLQPPSPLSASTGTVSHTNNAIPRALNGNRSYAQPPVQEPPYQQFTMMSTKAVRGRHLLPALPAPAAVTISKPSTASTSSPTTSANLSTTSAPEVVLSTIPTKREATEQHEDDIIRSRPVSRHGSAASAAESNSSPSRTQSTSAGSIIIPPPSRRGRRVASLSTFPRGISAAAVAAAAAVNDVTGAQNSHLVHPHPLAVFDFLTGSSKGGAGSGSEMAVKVGLGGDLRAIVRIRLAINVNVEGSLANYPYIRLSTPLHPPLGAVLRFVLLYVLVYKHAHEQLGASCTQDDSVMAKGQDQTTRAKANIERVNSKRLSLINLHNANRCAMVSLGHLDSARSFPPLTFADTVRLPPTVKRALGQSRKFDGAGWTKPFASTSTSHQPLSTDTSSVPPQDGSQKRPHETSITGFKLYRLKAVKTKLALTVTSSSLTSHHPTADKTSSLEDGWIWRLGRVSNLSVDDNRAWEEEDLIMLCRDVVHWFLAEAEMERWKEQREMKLVEFIRGIKTFKTYEKVWSNVSINQSDEAAAVNSRKKAAMFRQMASQLNDGFISIQKEDKEPTLYQVGKSVVTYILRHRKVEMKEFHHNYIVSSAKTLVEGVARQHKARPV
ncbi:hypothetical protein BJ165DRAFT_1598483 [Panaeolus papilionaceus]|nr:hypothetical protein BJ165DRAFT_1598483 [Panaeolus papilionaceus]